MCQQWGAVSPHQVNSLKDTAMLWCNQGLAEAKAILRDFSPFNPHLAALALSTDTHTLCSLLCEVGTEVAPLREV